MSLMAHLPVRVLPLATNETAARVVLAKVRWAICQAEFIGWPALADSFKADEARLLEAMRARGWSARGVRA